VAFVVFHLSGLLGLEVLLATTAQAQRVSEQNVKAAYVYNLARFVEWPAQSLHTHTAPITLCILGQTPVSSALAEAVKGEKIDDRALLVQPLSTARQAGGCHVLFIAASERKDLHVILSDLKDVGLLTVGETEEFLDEGGAVNFKLEGTKVRIEINMNAVDRQKLRISPRLLSLARVVRK
jgi:hypothetical protein